MQSMNYQIQYIVIAIPSSACEILSANTVSGTRRAASIL